MSAETFDHAYFVFIDAAGHSSIVQNNPRDRAEQGFDLLRAVVDRRLATVATEAGCGLAKVWQWAGDGGLLLVNDDRESVAVGAALGVARTLLTLDLPQLRQRFAELSLHGDLRLRVSVHKGTMRYRGPGSESAIYSPAINLAAHLERAAPPDTVAISADVYRVAGSDARDFQPVGPFEGTDVYVWQAGGGHPARPWLARHGLAGGVPVHAYPERPSQAEKARLVDAAAADVLDVGVSLNTCANYLVTRERPALHRRAVLDLLARGGRYRCLLTDPDSAAAAAIGELRGEDVPGKIRDSLARFERFRGEQHPGLDRLEVYTSDSSPGLAVLAVDLDDPQAVLLYSPYLTPLGPGRPHLERADMPHYLVSPASGRLFSVVADQVRRGLRSATRVL
jgi:class 3 adenylate cyclase